MNIQNNNVFTLCVFFDSICPRCEGERESEWEMRERERER